MKKFRLAVAIILTTIMAFVGTLALFPVWEIPANPQYEKPIVSEK